MGVRTFPAPKPPNWGKCGWCKWCGDPIPDLIDGKRSTQRMWHPPCAREFNLHTNSADQRRHVIARDGDRCRICGDKPHGWRKGETITVHRQTPGFRHLAEVGSPEWLRLVETWRRENPPAHYTEIDWACTLEVDHRVPLWSVADLPDEERRWYFGPGNLWLLCPRHHKQKTAREAIQRAALKAFIKAQLPLPL